MGIAKRIKQARENKKMTLLELGEIIGKSEGTVQRYESGHIKNLKSDTIEGIARALSVSPAYLMGWEDEPASSTNKDEEKESSLLKQIQDEYGKDAAKIMKYSIKLNKAGQAKALEFVFDLADMPKYTKKETPGTELKHA